MEKMGKGLPINKIIHGDWESVMDYRFLAVFADSLNALAVGAPGDPGFRIFSPLPALMRSRLAWMLL